MARQKLDPHDDIRVKPKTPRRYAPTVQLALECPSSLAWNRCPASPVYAIEAVYNVHDYFEERRAALFALSDLLAECEKGDVDKVIPIRQRGGQKA